MTECPVCKGFGVVVWKQTKQGTQEPVAPTQTEYDDMDVQKSICPDCDGTGLDH